MADLESVAQTKPIENCLTLEQVLEIVERIKRRYEACLEKGFIPEGRKRHYVVRWRLYNRELDLKNGR